MHADTTCTMDINISYPATHGKTVRKCKYLLYVSALVASTLYFILFFVYCFVFFFLYVVCNLCFFISLFFNSCMILFNDIIYMQTFIISFCATCNKEYFLRRIVCISLVFAFSSLSPCLSYFLHECVLLALVHSLFSILYRTHFYYF